MRRRWFDQLGMLVVAGCLSLTLAGCEGFGSPAAPCDPFASAGTDASGSGNGGGAGTEGGVDGNGGGSGRGGATASAGCVTPKAK